MPLNPTVNLPCHVNSRGTVTLPGIGGWGLDAGFGVYLLASQGALVDLGEVADTNALPVPQLRVLHLCCTFLLNMTI